MKILSRDFTTKEKVLLLLAAIIAIALIYYKFVYVETQNRIAAAEAEAVTLQAEYDATEAKIAQLEHMQANLDAIKSNPNISTMGSYNNQKAEISALNGIFQYTTDYSLSFADVTRDGDQIRRDVSFTFKAGSVADADNILKAIINLDERCLISDISYTSSTGLNYSGLYASEGLVSVSGTVTFYETMVGGTEDAGLPAETVVTDVGTEE